MVKKLTVQTFEQYIFHLLAHSYPASAFHMQGQELDTPNNSAGPYTSSDIPPSSLVVTIFTLADKYIIKLLLV
jgi:hypothetical protein